MHTSNLRRSVDIPIPFDESAPQAPRDAASFPSDARLVEEVRNGDRNAFAALVTRYETSLLRLLTRMVNDRELARDLTQETLWRAYSRLDRFDPSRRFGPWLLQIGVNLALDELRRRSSRVLIEKPLSLSQMNGSRVSSALASPNHQDRDELAREVQFVLHTLPLHYRTVLILRDLEGFSCAEAAAIIGKSEMTVRWRLARARTMFRDRWVRRETTTHPHGREAYHAF